MPENTFSRLLFYLKASRPGLWFATLWLYLLPTSQMTDIADHSAFWIGLFYVTFPLNLLVYGWNDIVDREIDAVNPRKDSFLFGARGTKAQLDRLPKVIIAVQLLCLPVLLYYVGSVMLLLFGGILLVNGLYNWPEGGLRTRPPLELLCQVGYLLVVPFSIAINDLPELGWVTYLYLLLFAWQSHLMGEVMDINPDRAAGRRTTGTVLGVVNTKWLIIGIVGLEVALLVFYFDDIVFGGMLGIGLLWLLIDILFLYRNKTYTVFQMQLFGVMSNIVAVASMGYVWYSGCLV